MTKMPRMRESLGKPESENAGPPTNGQTSESPFSAMARELLEVYIRQVCLIDQRLVHLEEVRITMYEHDLTGEVIGLLK